MKTTLTKKQARENFLANCPVLFRLSQQLHLEKKDTHYSGLEFTKRDTGWRISLNHYVLKLNSFYSKKEISSVVLYNNKLFTFPTRGAHLGLFDYIGPLQFVEFMKKFNIGWIEAHFDRETYCRVLLDNSELTDTEKEEKKGDLDTLLCIESSLFCGNGQTQIDLRKNSGELAAIIEICSRASILEDILSGKIYNLKTLYQAFGKCCTGHKVTDWKLLRKYYTNSSYYRISDNNGLCYSYPLSKIYKYTKDFNKSLNALLNVKRYSSKETLVRDLLSSASQLNEKVDLTWSENKMNEEHQKQIIKQLEKEVSEKDDNPIYDENFVSSINTDFNPSIKLLNSEKSIFTEAKAMSHCLYSCYFNRIKRKEMMAFHINSPEDCTFSIFKDSNTGFIFDQAHLSHNRTPSSKTISQIKAFLIQAKESIIQEFYQGTKGPDAVLAFQRLDDDFKRFDSDDMPLLPY